MDVASAALREERLPLGQAAGLPLSLVKRASEDIGQVILSPDAPSLIAGVTIETGLLHPDDRGFFTESFRIGSTSLTRGLGGCPTLQLSAAASYPGTIKALHYHFEQTDYWAPLHGAFQVVLCDLREGSPSHGHVNTVYVGTLRPWRIKIPPGVGHGYKVVGPETATLVYRRTDSIIRRTKGESPSTIRF